MEGGIVIKKVEVTPQMAQRWLNECNKHNRPLYQNTIDAYALDMKRGYWAFNHQPICFDNEDVLMDGQQRLSAIVLSGKTIPFLIARNWPVTFETPEGDAHQIQETVDGGKPRGLGDRLTLAYGVQNANLKCAIIAVIVNIATGKKIKMSTGVIYEVLKTYDKEIESILDNRGYGKMLSCAPVLGAFTFAAKCFKEKIIEFERLYFKGENIGGPILTLRNYMLNRPSNHSGHSNRRIIQNHVLNALMYYVLGEPLKRLVSSQQGLEFFQNKQKKIIYELSELFRL